MNKKYFSILLVAVLTVGYAQAQLTFGARAGLYYVTGVDKYDGHKQVTNYFIIPGFQLGVIAETKINEVFAIQPGLLFGQIRAKEKFSQGRNDGKTFDCYNKRNINFLQVPVNFQYNFDLNGATVYLQAGPYLGFMLGGKEKWKRFENWQDNDPKKGDRKIKFGKSPDNYDPQKETYTDSKPLDLGLGIGLGLKASNVQLGFNYNIGINNVAVDDLDGKYKSKMNGLSLNLTYFFGD